MDKPNPAAQSASPESLSSDRLDIDGVSEITVLRYFETLNAAEYEATAALFAEDGIMHPPFENGIAGPTAIAAYLRDEATGMQLHPREGTVEALESGEQQFQIKGKVETSLFSVNVGWNFILNSHAKISSVGIKLLASPRELLNLRNKS